MSKRITNPLMRLILSAVLIPLMGCANQWRDGSNEMTGDEVIGLLEQAGSPQSSSGSANGVAAALEYKDDPNTTIFFADAPSMGPVAAILAVDSLEFARPGEDLWSDNVSKARIFFLDSPSTTDRQNSLVIGIAKEGEADLKYFGFTGQGTIHDGEFEVELSGPTGTVVLRSWDTEGDDLMGVIQLRVYEVGNGGSENYVGKFTTLIGYQQ